MFTKHFMPDLALLKPFFLCLLTAMNYGRGVLLSHVGVISSVKCPRDETSHDVTRTQSRHLHHRHPAAAVTQTH